MKIYQAGEYWVIGVEGGYFDKFNKGPEAKILNEKPRPGRMWSTPVEVVNDIFKRQQWDYLYSFQEFLTEQIKFIS
jgi:hypothetical protein